MSSYLAGENAGSGTGVTSFNGRTGAVFPATGDYTIGQITGGTTGSVLFIGASGEISQNNTNFFWDNTNSRLGIGNSAPTNRLHTTTTTANAFSTAEALTGSTNISLAGLRVDNNDAGATPTSGILLTAGSANAAQWGMFMSKTASTAGDLFWATRSGAGTSAERMRITNAGNVGIGTTTPSYTLDVSSSGVSQARVSGTNSLYNILDMTAFGSGSAVQNMIRFNSGASTNFSFGVDQANSNALTFSSGSLLTSAPRMVITTAGNVGIGTTSPQERLQVDGRIRGYMNANNDGFVAMNGAGSGILGITRQNAITNASVQYAAFGDIGFTAGSTSTINPAGSTSNMYITSTGLVGINTTSPSSTKGGLDIASGGLSLVLGADSGATTRTNSTNKIFRVGGYHYTNAEEPVAAIMVDTSVANSNLKLGGGTALMNAATSIDFYVAANNTTVTGTTIVGLSSSGIDFKDFTDNTKVGRWDISAITTGTTRTYTLPDATGTIVLTGNTATLTNKTITSSTNVLGGVTMTLGSDATGDIYYRNAGGVLTRLGVGSNGQVLTLAAGLPSWAAAGGVTDYSVKAIQTGTTSIGTSYTVLAFAGEEYDTDTMHDNATNNSRITFTHAGKYRIIGNCKLGNNITHGLQIRLNGTTVLASSTAGNGGIGGYESTHVGVDRVFSAADYVELLAINGTTGNSSGDRETNFSASLISL